MQHAVIPNAERRPLPFFLAAEEWIAARMPADECYFMAWQVAPTVICGRNQDISAEVDLDFCRRRGIEVWRRKSGGGAVYADSNNIMFSYVGPRTSVSEAFGAYTCRVVGALRSLGLDAEATGRNDICIDGRKVAGNAFMQAGGRNIVHGTMLFDTDAEAMAGALTPSRAKLESHRVHSVASRITTVREHLPTLTLDEFMHRIVNHVCDGTIILPEDALPEIERIEQTYRQPGFRYAGTTRAVRAGRRVAGAGTLTPLVATDGGLITGVSLTGDFFSDERLARSLDALAGQPPEREAIRRVFGDEPLIAGIDNDALASIIADAARP